MSDLLKVRVSGSLDVHVDRHGAAGPRVLMVHGWMTSGGVFEPVIDELARVARVFVPDLRGAGRTATAESYRLADYAEDVIGLLEHIGGAAVVGFSMGGAIAQLVAAERPDLVQKLVLLNTVPARGMELPAEARALFASSAGDRELQRTVFELSTLQLEADGCERLLDLAATVDEAAIVQSLDAWTRGGFQARLPEIEAPTHVVATSDPFLPPELLQEAVVDRIPSAKLHVIEGPGHYPMWEAPAETTRLLAELLSPAS